MNDKFNKNNLNQKNNQGQGQKQNKNTKDCDNKFQNKDINKNSWS